MASLIERIGQANPSVGANDAFINAVYQASSYNRPASQAELNRFRNQKVADVANIVLRDKSPFTNPLNKGGANAPIPVNGLPTGQDTNQQLSKILGANLPSGIQIPSTIAGLLAIQGKTSAEEKAYDKLGGQLIKVQKKLGQQGADLTSELEKQGVPQAYQQVKELNLRAAQLQGEIEQFDAATVQEQSALEDQAIPTGLILGQKGQLQKQRDMTRLSKTAELSSTVALSQAYQGNATLGSQLAQQAIDIKYQPMYAEIDTLKTQLGFASEKMTRADQKRSSIIGTLIGLETDRLNELKAKESAIEQLAVQAASNGAPLSLVQAMKSSGDLTTASNIGARYISGLNADIENIAMSAAEGGAPQNVIDQIRSAANLGDAARIGQYYLPYARGKRDSNSNKVLPSEGFTNAEVEKSVREDATQLFSQIAAGTLSPTDAFRQLRMLYSTKEVTDSALRNTMDFGGAVNKYSAVVPEGDYEEFSKGTATEKGKPISQSFFARYSPVEAVKKFLFGRK